MWGRGRGELRFRQEGPLGEWGDGSGPWAERRGRGLRVAQEAAVGGWRGPGAAGRDAAPQPWNLPRGLVAPPAGSLTHVDVQG